MSKFDQILAAINDVESLTQVTEEGLSSINDKHPGIQSEYLEFLRDVGAGNLGMLIVYSSLIEPIEVYTSARKDELSNYILFADDMQGYCYAFDKTANYRVVEIDPRGDVDTSIESSFVEFLQSFISP